MFLTLFDIVVGVICGIFAFWGLKKGMLGLLLKFSIFLLSIVFTLLVFSIPKLLLQKYFNDVVFTNILYSYVA